MKRDKDVSNLLYDDALRRKQKEEHHIAEFLKKEFMPNINNNTNDLVIKKIYNEFVNYVAENVSPETE